MMTAINKNINNTVSLDSTNVRLTSNIKFIIDESNNFWFDMIESNNLLSNAIYKAYKINDNFSYGDNLKNYASSALLTNSLFSVKSEELKIDDNLKNEYAQLYKYGAYNDFNDSYVGKLKFFAPFYYNNEDKPDAFVIIRTTKNVNNISDALNNGDIIKIFNLEKFNNYVLNDINQSYLSTDFDENFVFEGIDLTTGKHIKKQESTLIDILNNETTITEYENWLTNCYERNSMIFSNIVNLEFSFSDLETINGFNNYVGFYVKFNEVSKSTIDNNFSNKNFIKLIKTENSLINYNTNHIFQQYLEDVQTSYSTARGNDDRKTIDLVFKLQPELYSFFQIINNDLVDYTLTFTENIIGSNIEETIDNVINEINFNYTGNETTILAEKISKNSIRLTTNNIVYGDVLKISKSTNSIYIEKPLFGNNVGDLFLGPDEKAFTSPYYFDASNGNVVKMLDSSGIEFNANILRVYKYRDVYVYDTDKILPEKFGESPIIFSKYVQDQPLLCSLIDHYKIDYSGNSNDYSDVLDFDVSLYKEYLLKIVNGVNYIGNAPEYFGVNPEDLTPQQIFEYKELVISKIEEFFNTVEVKRQYLIKNINLIDFEATNVLDEYDRLDEKNNQSLKNINKLHQFVNKFAAIEGLDCYNNPYRLNTVLPFRKDNFSTSTQNQQRDLREHTLSWFIIGEGKPPYYNIEDSKIKKLLSYSSEPIEPILLESIDYDEYDKLIYESDSGIRNAWSYIYYDSEKDSCYSFFKGVNYQFESNDLEGYRFSVILKSTNLTDNDFDVQSFKNDTFKTYTIVIYFYIPDPILTSAEGGFDYYLDRLLLYFSKEIYATTDNQVDFGIEKISLDLYNNVSTKSYLGQNVTNNWFYNTQNQGAILYVGRGDSGIFNTNFSDILKINDDLVVFYTMSDDPQSPFYGMYITFKNIVEIGQNHFWCKQIIVEGNITEDPSGIDDDISNNIVDEIYTYDVYQEYINNPNIFYENNEIFISKSIAYELANFEKILTASANNERFKEITLAKLKNWFSENTLKGIQVSIIEPKYLSIGISLFSESSSLKQLQNKYIYPLYRHITKNVPLLKPIQEYKRYLNFEKLIPYKEQKYDDFSKVITNSKFIKIDKQITDYERGVSSGKETKFSFLKSNTNKDEIFIDLDWSFNPIELRNYISLVFNSYNRIDLSTSYKTSINITDLLKDRIVKWCDLKNINESQKNEYATLIQSKQILESSLIYKNGFVENDISNKFCENTFLKIYKIDKIVDDLGKTYEYSLNGTTLTLINPKLPQALSKVSNNTKQAQSITITFLR